MRLLITGGSGMLGSALSRIAKQTGIDVIMPARNVLDLEDNFQVSKFLTNTRPDVVIHSAALVSGISANLANPINFLTKNIQMDNNLLQACDEIGVQRLIYFGSSCMYPKDLMCPMTVDQLLLGKLEPTNEGYALAKLVGTKHVQYVSETKKVVWRVFIPSNLYGPGDHFAPERSHLVAAIIRKVVEAKINHSSSIEMWGDGLARRASGAADREEVRLDVYEPVIRDPDRQHPDRAPAGERTIGQDLRSAGRLGMRDTGTNEDEEQNH